jgi:hypothetical protein
VETAQHPRELVALDVADIEERPEGLRVTIRRSKTDQEGAGAVVAVCRGVRRRCLPRSADAGLL